MPAKLATLFAALKVSPGSLSNHGRHIVIFIAAIMLGAAIVIYLRTTWNAEISENVITFTALFVGAAIILIGLARKGLDSDKEVSRYLDRRSDNSGDS